MTVIKRTAAIATTVVLLVFLCSTVFIGLQCYSGTDRAPSPPNARSRVVAAIEGYDREEASTFLTLPEWYIVYNTDEFARFIGSNPPSRFPYIGSIRQYWRYYGGVCHATRGVYPFSTGNHLMLAVIGSSLSIEYALKSVYENSIGRVSEWIGGRDTPEDAFAQRVATEYGTFMHTVPWYDFPFRRFLVRLWKETPRWGPHLVRKYERRFALTLEYGVKAVYGWLIRKSSHAAYGAEDLRIHAWIENAGVDIFADGRIKKVKDVGPRAYIVTIPRYEAFTQHALTLLARGVRFADIAGNDEILLTALVGSEWIFDGRESALVLDEPVLTDRTERRIALKVPVRALHTVAARLQSRGARIEHIYDY